MERLFVAATFPASVIDFLNQLCLLIKDADRCASLVAVANLHCTMRFIGEVSKEDGGRIRHSFRNWQIPSGQYDFAPDTYTYFGRSNLGTLVLHGTASDAFAKAVDQVESMLVDECGLEQEKRHWRPHITLARRVDRKLVDLAALPGILQKSQPIKSIVLLKSEFTPAGMRYTPLISHDLSAEHVK